VCRLRERRLSTNSESGEVISPYGRGHYLFFLDDFFLPFFFFAAFLAMTFSSI
jgi:hypothetical protein